MSSSLTEVVACLFLELLKSGLFKFIIRKDSNYFRYIDDISYIYPRNNDFTKITDRLNNVEPSINFTYKQENNNTLNFLDILLINNKNKFEFKVHHESPNKKDDIHFYSHHNTKIKRELFNGFRLRTLRIAPPLHF